MPRSDPDPQRTLERPADEGRPAASAPAGATPQLDGRTPGAISADGGDAVLEQPGRYQVKGEYGRGGQSRVLLAVDTLMGREIALKELLPALSRRGGSEESPHGSAPLARFLREGRVTAQLEHPNIVPVYELGKRADGTHYVTQKLVRGRTLRQAVDECRTLAQRLELVPHLHDVCNAVAYAHSRGVVHRDLKPENVMVGQFGETVVLDWGLAQVKGRPAAPLPQGGDTPPPDAEVRVTVEGAAVGTPQYMSPEQARGDVARIDERSDVWGLGAMLYELLAGQPPFAGKTVREVIGQVTFSALRPVRELEPAAPPDLCAVAERALAKERSRRYPDAAALATELAAYRAGGRVAAYEYGSYELLRRFVRKNRLLTAAGVAAALAVAVLVADLRLRYAAARAQLAQTLVSSARAAEREQGWARAAALFAAARVQEDRADARWGLLAASRRAAVPLLRLGNEAEVPSVAFSPDGALLAAPVGSEVRVWDARTGAEVARLHGHGRKVWRASFGPDGRLLASAAEDGSVRLWDVQARRELAALEGPSRDVRTVEISADGRLLASVGYDRALTVRDLATHALLPAQSAARVWGAAFSPDGKLLAAGSLDGPVLLLDPQTGRELARLPGHGGAVQSLAFSPDGRLLATASLDGTVRLWGVAGREPLGRFEGFNTSNSPVHLAFSPDGLTLAYTARGNAVRLVDAARARPLARLEGHANTLLGLAFAPDGRLATAGRDGAVRVWDVGPVLSRGDRLEAPGGMDCAAVAFTRDGAALASGCAGRAALLWDLGERRVRATLAHADVPVTLALAPDEASLLTGSLDGAVRLWDVRGGAPLQALGPLPGAAAGVAFVRGGAAAASRSGSIVVWDLPSGGRRLLLQSPSRVNALSASPDGGLLASAGDDGAVLLWDLERGALQRSLGGHNRRATGAAFSPDGRWLASVGSDAQVMVWDLATGAVLRRLDGGGALLGVAISPDGRLLASGGESVRVWDAATGELLLQREGDEPAATVAFTPDGRALLTGTFGGTLRFLRWGEPDRVAPPAEALRATLERFHLRLAGAAVAEAE